MASCRRGVAYLRALWLQRHSSSVLRLATFLGPGALLWVYVVLGAAVSVVVMLGIANAVKPWGVSALTFPFVITTWLLLLATYGFSGSPGLRCLSGNVVTAFQPYEVSPLKLVDLVQGVLQSISQVFLKGSGVAALLLLAGLAVNSLRSRRIRSRRCDTGGRYGTSFRRRKRTGHRRPPRLQPGPDGDRARHGVLSAELAGRGVHRWARCSQSLRSRL